MKPHKTKEIRLNDLSSAPISGAASTTISDVFNATEEGRLFMCITAQVSGVTAGAGITFKLQESAKPDSPTSWVDVKTSAAISAAGFVTLKLNNATADSALLPLLPYCRVILTTGTGSIITVDNLWVSEPA